MAKNFSPGGGYFLSYGGSIASIYTKIIYNLTIAIVNECFEFQNDFLIIAIINKCFEFQNYWLKIIRIRYNCTQFCPIPLC